MKRLTMAAVVGLGLAGLGTAVGCEEKPASPQGTNSGGGLIDAAKGAADKAGSAVKDAGKAAGDAAKAATDKAKDVAAGAVDALKKEVSGMVEVAKGKLEKLTEGGKALAADKKPDFDKTMTDLNGQFKALSDGVTGGLKDLSGDGLMKKLGEFKDMGSKLMSGITSAAEKFGIKL